MAPVDQSIAIPVSESDLCTWEDSHEKMQATIEALREKLEGDIGKLKLLLSDASSSGKSKLEAIVERMSKVEEGLTQKGEDNGAQKEIENIKTQMNNLTAHNDDWLKRINTHNEEMLKTLDGKVGDMMNKTEEKLEVCIITCCKHRRR